MRRETQTPEAQKPRTQRRDDRWDERRIKSRVWLLADDVARIVKVTTSGGTYDLRTLLWFIFSGEWAGTPRTLTVEETLGGIADRVRLPAGSSSTRTTRVLRIIGRLEGANLVRDMSERGKRTLLRVLSLNGRGEEFRYVDPKSAQIRKVLLPAELVTNGWLTTLGKHALAMYLVSSAEETNQHRDFKDRPWMWRLTRDDIQAKYGLHNDAITAGKHELAEYGLLQWAYELRDLRSPSKAHVVPQSYRHDEKHGVLTAYRPHDAPRWRIEYEEITVTKAKANVFRRLRQPRFVEQEPKVLRMKKPSRKPQEGPT